MSVGTSACPLKSAIPTAFVRDIAGCHKLTPMLDQIDTGDEHLSSTQSLIRDLLWIYETTGREVTYVSPSGIRKPYWPYRYLQAVKRAIENGDVVELVERIVMRGDSTSGFGCLQEARRLDLTLEAFVIDESKPYHHFFSDEAVFLSRERLLEAKRVMNGV